MSVNTNVRYNKINTQRTGDMVSPSVTEMITPLASYMGSLPLFLLDTLISWQHRSTERTNLATMSPHLLKDMGISADEAAREVGKAFWQK